MTSQGELKSFKYVGLIINQKQGCIYLDQQLHTEERKEFGISREKRMSKKSPLTTKEE